MFQEFEAPRFQDNRHMKVVRLSALRTGRLYSLRKFSLYSFLLEAESTPGPTCSQKDYVNEKFWWHHRELNPQHSGLLRSASTNCATVCPYLAHMIPVIQSSWLHLKWFLHLPQCQVEGVATYSSVCFGHFLPWLQAALHICHIKPGN